MAVPEEVSLIVAPSMDTGLSSVAVTVTTPPPSAGMRSARSVRRVGTWRTYICQLLEGSQSAPAREVYLGSVLITVCETLALPMRPLMTVNSFGSLQSFAELAAKVCDAGDTVENVPDAFMVTSATGRLVSATW